MAEARVRSSVCGTVSWLRRLVWVGSWLVGLGPRHGLHVWDAGGNLTATLELPGAHDIQGSSAFVVRASDRFWELDLLDMAVATEGALSDVPLP